MVNKVGIIVQAHMGSERLPKKVLREIDGITVLGRVILRLKQIKNCDDIIIATSTLKQDDVIVDESLKYGVKVFRGSDDDVLARYYYAAKKNDIDTVVRVCSDNIFVDPEIIEDEIEYYKENNYDILTSGSSVPLGLGSEISSFEKLEEAMENATTQYEHEHVFPYVYDHGTVYYYEISDEENHYRLTLDTPEDWEFLNKLARRLDGINSRLVDIREVLEKEPELLEINKNVIQRK